MSPSITCSEFLKGRKVSSILTNEHDDWDSVTLHRYHATDIHKKIGTALRKKTTRNTIMFEPNEVWQRWEGKAANVSVLTPHEIEVAEQQITEYLERLDDDDKKDADGNQDAEPEPDQLDDHETPPHRVDLGEYQKDWEASTPTATDQKLLALYRMQTTPNTHNAKIVRNLLIMSLHVQHKMPKKVIAEMTNLSPAAVRRILRDITGAKSDTLSSDLEKVIAQTYRMTLVKKKVRKMVDGGRGLITVPAVRQALQDDEDIYLSRFKARRVIVKDMGLVYRKVGSFQAYVNSRKNITLRQLFAQFLARSIFAHQRVFCNFDECVVSDTTSKAYSYGPRGRQMSRSYKKDISNVNVFLMVIDDGTRIMQYSTGTNNQVTFCSWLFDLTAYLDRARPGFRDTHSLVMDNMSGHKTPLAIRVINHLRLPVTFTAPASMTAMPVERIFGILKNQSIDPRSDPTRR